MWRYAMAHDDHKCSTNTYYLEQISAIAGCGALGLFLFLTWFDGSLMFFLVPKYHPLVLISCYLLLGIVTIRSLAVWFSSVRQKSGSTHSHTHGHAHECPSHDQCHTHDHEHVWSPWHYVVL